MSLQIHRPKGAQVQGKVHASQDHNSRNDHRHHHGEGQKKVTIITTKETRVTPLKTGGVHIMEQQKREERTTYTLDSDNRKNQSSHHDHRALDVVAAKLNGHGHHAHPQHPSHAAKPHQKAVISSAGPVGHHADRSQTSHSSHTSDHKSSHHHSSHSSHNIHHGTHNKK